MHSHKKSAFIFGCLFVSVVFFASVLHAGQQPAAAPAKKVTGTIKAVSTNSITITPDSGDEMTVQVGDSTKLLQVPPGAPNMKEATPVQLQDLQVGDRILVAWRTPDAAAPVTASTVVVMKSAEIKAKNEQQRDDWTKRGIGGIVESVDAANGTVTVSVSAGGAKKAVVIHTAPKTVVRRYSPDSVKFEDAKRSELSEIKPKDQLRARGIRSDDGSELAADEIVSGTFRNLAGTILSTDASANTISIQDLVTKKPVLVKLTNESKLQKIPAAMAQRVAMRLKGTPNGGGSAPPATPAPDAPAKGGMASPRGGSMDLQQFLSRVPSVTLADLQKGDAVMIVSTEGTATGGVTAITVLGGVEPLLEASSKGGQAMTLSPWSLGSSAGEGEAP